MISTPANVKGPRSNRTPGRGGRRVAIVGAGPGGLAAAVLLAAAGADVTVYEAMDRVGGRTSRVSLTGSDGREYRFDRGPTFFLMPHVLEEIFAAAGETLSDHVDLTRLDPMYRLLLGQPGGSPQPIDATQDIAEMSRRIGRLSERDGRAFPRFIADNREKLRLSEPILRRAMRSPLDVLGASHPKLGLMLKPHKSVHRLLGEYFEDERVKLAVSFQSKYLGMSPLDCPSLFTILPLIEYEYGVWHPSGGCHAICVALAGLVEKLGGRVELGAAVERVLFSGRAARGVVVSGRHVEHDAVVLNADATHAFKSLVPSELRTGPARAYRDGALDAMRYSCGTYMLYLGLEGEVDLPHHTIYTSAAYRENLADITEHKRLSDDPSMYICNASGTDRSLAPDGGTALYVLVPAPNLLPAKDGSPPPDWAGGAAREARERALDQAERVFGITDIRGRLRAEHQITPADWAAMGINHGATFNLAHNLTQMLHWRPRNEVQGFEALYLVGGGTHPGSGLPTIFLSAEITAGLLARRLGLRDPNGIGPRALSVAEAAALS